MLNTYLKLEKILVLRDDLGKLGKILLTRKYKTQVIV
jgi:hypothetical protein